MSIKNVPINLRSLIATRSVRVARLGYYLGLLAPLLRLLKVYITIIVTIRDIARQNGG